MEPSNMKDTTWKYGVSDPSLEGLISFVLNIKSTEVIWVNLPQQRGEFMHFLKDIHAK